MNKVKKKTRRLGQERWQWHRKGRGRWYGIDHDSGSYNSTTTIWGEGERGEGGEITNTITNTIK